MGSWPLARLESCRSAAIRRPQVATSTRQTFRNLAARLSGTHTSRAGDRSIAVLGFSMGGLQALRATALEPDSVGATVLIYGGSYESLDDSLVERISAPILAVTGADDSWGLSSAWALLNRMAEGGVPTELYVYPGVGHAFAQPLYADGTNFDEVVVESSWRLVDDFLERHM